MLGAAGGYQFRSNFAPLEVTPVAAQAVNGGGTRLEASGYVVARRTATVASKIIGRLTEVRIEEGQKVAPGEIIARIDDASAQATMAEANRRAAAIQGQGDVAAVVLREVEAQYRRSERLHAAGYLSDDAAERALAARDKALAEFELARREVATARAVVESARQALEDTVVRAPFAGVVTVKAAQPGEIVSPGSAGGGFTRTGIATIVDMASLEVQVDVSETFISRIHDGMPARIELDAYPDWLIPAEVIAVVPTADRAKATVTVRVAIKTADPRIVPEMAAKVDFLDGTAAVTPSTEVVVPRSAIQQSGPGKGQVFVIDGGIGRARPVKLGALSGDVQRVREGLAAGELIATDPHGLKDGARVHLTQASGR
jgi:RND family efflux transporter MFP subunit